MTQISIPNRSLRGQQNTPSRQCNGPETARSGVSRIRRPASAMDLKLLAWFSRKRAAPVQWSVTTGHVKRPKWKVSSCRKLTTPVFFPRFSSLILPSTKKN